MKIASVMFANSARCYDYQCPFPARVGQKAIVDTRRGEAEVEIVEIKDSSDKASAQIKRLVQEALF